MVAAFEMEPPPGLDEVPVEEAVAIDVYGRGAGLMGHLRKMAAEAKETGLPSKATVRVGEPPKDPTETLELDGLAPRALIIDHPGREELALPLFEGEYPRWRGLLATHKPAATKALALNPEILGRLAKLGRFYAELPLVWRFGGSLGAARLEIGPISGAAMPMCWAGIDPPPGIDTPPEVAS